MITVKKNGDTFTAKVKAIGSQEYVEQCLINLSMACHNLLPHQKPDIQFGAAHYADIREHEKSMENAVFSNTAARFDSGVPASSAPAVDYDGFSRRQIFNDNCSQQSAILGQASTSQAAFESSRKRKSLFHPSDIEIPNCFVKPTETIEFQAVNAQNIPDAQPSSSVRNNLPSVFFQRIFSKVLIQVPSELVQAIDKLAAVVDRLDKNNTVHREMMGNFFKRHKDETRRMEAALNKIVSSQISLLQILILFCTFLIGHQS